MPVLRFLVIAGLSQFCGEIQASALQCYECYFVTGLQNISNSEIFDDSCERGRTPESRFLKTCKDSSNQKLEMSCLRLFVNVTESKERYMTVRKCMAFLPSFPHECSNWTTTTIIRSSVVPNNVKGMVLSYDEHTPAEICRCTGNKCNKDDSISNSAVNEPCSLTKFTCVETQKCLRRQDRCDGFKDCGLGDISDEENCDSCTGAAFHCNITKRCISFWETCNGERDCGFRDVSDEENCDSCSSNSFHCNKTKRCIPIRQWCDGYHKDCGFDDLSDEDNCIRFSENAFRCTNSTRRVVPEKYICDGTNHCGRNNTIDEDNCRSCKNNAFHCKGSTRNCIPQLARCNGENDCTFPDKSDEENCDFCHPKSFHCKYNRTCIPMLSVCNGKNDCGDNSDEKNCRKTKKAADMTGENIISVTEIGTLHIANNSSNFTYVLFDSKNNTLVFDAKKYQLLINQTENTVSIVLEISNVTLEDEGNYTLQVTVLDENGKPTYINLHFTVIVKHLLMTFPEFSYTNLENSSLTFTPGDILKLVCVITVRSKAKVIWTWQNRSIDDWPPNLNYTFDEKNETLILEAIPLDEPGRFTCTAENSLGMISAYADINVVLKAVEPTVKLFELLGPVGGVFGAILLCFVVLVVRLQCRQRRLRGVLCHIQKELYMGAIENLNPDLDIKEQANLLPFEKGTWEIPRERVKLGIPLGSGAFGLVLKAEAIGVGGEEKSTVAVKTVKATADQSHFKALVMELKIMANLGKNLQIVNLIGACTENFSKTRELLIVMEFCKYGSLLSYMIENKKNFINQLDPDTDTIDPTICLQTDHNYLKSVNDQDGPMKDKEDDGIPEDYYKGDYKVKDAPSLQSTDLLSWAFQIAKGMGYLASRKILHGDLAARNVLLSENNIAKICDFGYARETFKDYDYQKDMKGQLLPIKWMAIESLLCGVFSSKSDCWSYGILLWEMFTLGNKPYPGVIANEEFCQRIKDGYRMEIPQYAPSSIYQIMMDCWKHEPTERPTFLQIADQLLELIGEMEQKRLHEMSDIYTTLNEVDKNTDYLMRMGEPAVFTVSYGQPDTKAMSSQLATPHYGPEPTCSITTNVNARKSGVPFATFRPAVPRRKT